MVTTVSRHDSLSVLIVEDEPRLRDLLARAIPDMGFACSVARTGEEALKQVEAEALHIILLDLNLPGMTGLDFLGRLREQKSRAAVIILTGYGDLETARRAIRLNVTDFLTKPCPLGELEVALDRARKQVDVPVGKSVRKVIEEGGIVGAANLEAAGASESSAEAQGKATLEEVERKHILLALKRHDGNRVAVATELNISLRTLYYRISEYQKQGWLA